MPLSGQSLAQYITHPHYVDAVAVRFYDENTDGDLVDADAADISIFETGYHRLSVSSTGVP